MKNAHKSTLMGLAVLAALTSESVVALEPGWYLGANAGQSTSRLDTTQGFRNVIGPGSALGPVNHDKNDTGWKVFGGYQFTRYLAFEASYVDFGRFSSSATTLPLGTVEGNREVDAANLDFVVSMPMGDRVSLFGRVGANFAHTSAGFTGSGAFANLNDHPGTRDTNVKYGVGLEYAMTRSLGLRIEMERYRINDAVGGKGDMDLFSGGLVWRFGGQNPPRSMPVTTPEPVTLAPAPPPPVSMAPPPPAPAAIPAPPVRRVTFTADSLFGFDRSNVMPEGKAHLDKFATDLRGTTYTTIAVTGHTDRIGSPAYNQGLSTRRAEAVRDYLVTSAAIPADKISARGLSESRPVTKALDCKGNAATKALIACLQPDRRVEVEVVGTK